MNGVVQNSSRWLVPMLTMKAVYSAHLCLLTCFGNVFKVLILILLALISGINISTYIREF